MDEKSWLTSAGSRALLAFAETCGSPRKLGLVLTEWCHRFTDGWDQAEPARELLFEVERIVEAGMTASEAQDCSSQLNSWTESRSEYLWLLLGADDQRELSSWDAKSAALDTIAGLLLLSALPGNEPWWQTNGYVEDPHYVAHHLQTDGRLGAFCDENIWLLRDVFGNPFRPVAFDAAWRTSTAVALARGMYESRDFGAMPILADALQDAGCDSDAVLSHCRDPQQVHVRGCWVVDLVLRKG